MRRIKITDRIIESYGASIGVQGDNQVETIEFVRPRMHGEIDLSLESIAYLNIAASDGSTGQIVLDQYVEGDNLILKWVVGNQVTAEPGPLYVQIRLSGLENVIWNSEKTMFQVTESIPVESPQPVVFYSASRSARLADPETEPPITVTERTMFIPPALQNIAVQNDQNSETVTILLPRYFDGHDLSQYAVYLRTKNSNEGYDPVFLTPEVQGNQLSMRWTLKPPQTSYPGKLSIQLWVTGQDFDWHSAENSVNILSEINGEPTIPITPPMIDELLRQLAELVQQAKTSETNAAESAQAAKDSKDSAELSAQDAQSSADQAAEATEQAQRIKGEIDGIQDDFRQESDQKLSEMESLRDETQAIKDSTAVNVSIDSSEDTGYRVGFKRADQSEPVWTPPLQAKVNAGTITMLEPDDLPTITQRGPASNRTFDFAIPRGQRGEPGRDGVSVSIENGMYAFEIRDGYLMLLYPNNTDPPPLKINTSGELIYTIS